jgi:hypothetical protein
MDDYISREAAISKILSDPTDAHYPSWYAEKLKQIPTADVRPVVRGEWWPAKDGYYGHVMCSACYTIESHETGFCPNCGCQMNGGRK